MSVPLPDPIVGGRGARSLENLDEFERVLELERRLESIQRNFDKLAGLYPLTDAELNDPSRETMLARPVVLLTTGHLLTSAHSASVFYIPGEGGGITPITPSANTQESPKTVYIDVTDFDTPTGYKPQFRIVATIMAQTTDPGTQTFTAGLTTLIQATGAGVSNWRWTITGTQSSFAVTNMAADQLSKGTGSWADVPADGLYTCYFHASGAIAAGAAVGCLAQIEMRWIPE